MPSPLKAAIARHMKKIRAENAKAPPDEKLSKEEIVKEALKRARARKAKGK